MLMEMIEEVLDSPLPIVEEAAPTVGSDTTEEETLEMILKMIPGIEVSEIGWSDVSTVDGKPVSGPQRKLLEDYLTNIAGETFKEKIANVSRFYDEGITIIGEAEDQSRTGRIQQAISYLVFYKTLTKVITNFNASSAGFSFESFLSALVKGEQIQTGNKTIADYTDGLKEGEKVPVSLKLYREGGLEVGGSYTDLVNDMVEPKYVNSVIGGGMRYVICTKSLEGKDLDQRGEIRIWQFDFTLDNIMWILMNSKEKSAECIRLPQEAVNIIQAKGAERSDYSNMLSLPQKAVMPSADEVYTKHFIPKFKGFLRATQRPNRLISHVLRSEKEVNDFLDQLQWDSNDELFHDVIITIKHEEGEEPQKENYGAQRGRAIMNDEELVKFARDWRDTTIEDTLANPEKNPGLAAALKSGMKRDGSGYTKTGEAAIKSMATQIAAIIKAANQAKSKVGTPDRKKKSYSPQADATAGVTSVFRASEIEAERKATIKGILEAEGGFLTPQDSAKVYFDTKNPDFKKALLRHSLGYLNTMHFSLNQAQATNKAPPAGDKQVPDKDSRDPTATKIVKGGTGAIDIGVLKVGGSYVAKAMDGVREILNEEIRGIFKSLKVLSDSLNTFFATGLNNDNLATKAIKNAQNISSKNILQPKKTDSHDYEDDLLATFGYYEE
jgi:hypothetical protein